MGSDQENLSRENQQAAMAEDLPVADAQQDEVKVEDLPVAESEADQAKGGATHKSNQGWGTWE